MSDQRTDDAAEIRELLHAVDGIVLRFDLETLVPVLLGDAAAGLGWSEGAWRDLFWKKILHPDESARVASLCRSTSRDGEERSAVHRVRTRDGEERWYSTRVRRFEGKLLALMVDVSQPRAVSDALSVRTDLHRLVLDQVPAVVYTTDRELRFTSGAGAAIAKLGHEPQQLIGVGLAEYFQTDDPEHPALVRHRRALAGEMLAYDIEHHGVTLENRLGPLRDHDGTIIGTIGVSADVTEERKLVREISRRNVEWEAVLKSIVDGVVVFDGSGRVTFVNDAGRRASCAYGVEGPATAHDREQLLELRTIDGRDVEPSFTERVLRGEVVEATEVSYVARGGERRFARVTGGPLILDDRSVGGVIVTHDITRRKRHEVERERLLREVTDRAREMQSVLDNLVDGVLVVARDGEVTFGNREARRLLGVGGESVTVRALEKCLGATSEQPLQKAHALALAGEVVRNVQCQRRSGPTFRMNAGPIRDGRNAVTGSVIVLRDVTDVAEFEHLKEQFIRVAAHELKTPVAVMKGYAQLLLRSNGGGPRAELEAIDRGAKRIDRVVQELIDVSQLNLGKLTMAPATVDLRALVTQVTEHAPRSSRHCVRVLRAARACVRGDRDRLEFVIANLIDNAVRYSPRGGDVDVTLDVNEGFAIVSVRDHGVGIPASKQSRIFERFFRAHTDTPYDYGGMGVALSLSREIILRHGGTMSFHSIEGSGSTFTLRVPLGGNDGGCSSP